MTRSVLDILMVKVFFDSRVWIHNSLNIHFLLSKNYFYFQNVTLLLQEKSINILFSTINCNDEWAFPEKKLYLPPAENIDFFEVDFPGFPAKLP